LIKNLIFFGLCIVITSCGGKGQEKESGLPLLFQPPVTIDLNDSIFFERRIPAKSEAEFKISKPIIVSAGDPQKLKTKLPISKPIGKPLVYPVLYETFKPHIPSQEDSSFILINSLSDTLPTGIPLSIKGRVVPCIYPQPVSALAPKSKDNSYLDIKYLDVDQGMKSSYIPSVLQDRRGNMWFGTEGVGISRYDGESFYHFSEKEGLSDNYIQFMLEDRKGNIWFATENGGLCKYDGNSFIHFTESEGLSNNSIWSLLEDKKGNLWIGSDGSGLSKFEPPNENKEGRITHYTKKEGLSNPNVMSLDEDKNGNIWIGTRGGGVNKLVQKEGEELGFIHLTKDSGLNRNSVISVESDQQGNLWIGTWSGGINLFKIPTKDQAGSIAYFTKSEGLSSNYINGIFESRNGTIWISSWGSGLTSYTPPMEGQTGSFTHYSEKEGLNSNNVRSIIEDESGILWFGTIGGGVSFFNPNSFSHLIEEDLNTDIIYSVLLGKDERTWYGTWGEGVYIREESLGNNGSEFFKFSSSEGLSNDFIFSMLEDSRGNFWFGTQGGGVNKYEQPINGNTGKVMILTEREGLGNNIVWSIIEDRRGNLWFGTQGGGASMYTPSKEGMEGSFTNFTQNGGLSNDNVLCMIEDSKGNLWFGTHGGGVSKLVLKGDVESEENYFIHITEKDGLGDNNIWSLFEDSRGNIWFGTEGGGANMFTPSEGKEGGSLTFFTETEGLSHNVVQSITEDEDGNIWIATEKGLNLIVFEKGLNPLDSGIQPRIYSFFKEDGLKALDFYSKSVLLDNKNNMQWGSGKSLTSLDLNNFSVSNNAPKLQLNYLEVNQGYFDFHNLKNSNRIGINFKGVGVFNNYPKDLKLAYDKNHLTFHFSAIDWGAPHKIRYSYRVKGMDKPWSLPSDQAFADYRNLRSGSYTFIVRAIGESQEWSSAMEFPFVIQPPWWNTWLAKTGYGIIGLWIVFGFIRLRTAQLKQRQKELETDVANATLEIREQKEEIEDQHKKIKDSIAYAKRIQSAILPPGRIVKEYLKESFILYKPKDVVAGDFYWMHNLPPDAEHKNGRVLFSAADCTGHGVPGAMISVVCNNALNRAVREYSLSDPGKILDKAREIVIQEFEKSDEEVKDGMDLALCILDGNKLQYAGAHNPLWIVRNGELLETKGDRQPIGIYDRPMPYTTHTFDLESGDIIYIFSDGFADQFGGEKGKKFMSSNFKRLVLSIRDESMEKQRVLLDNAFEEWKGNLEQIDDVCVIGVRI
jgi:ligand-binding sensor domain-containing protein/serine phosphatase RsbU (regulator of sigma subunit)